jgi:hypothetical protein
MIDMSEKESVTVESLKAQISDKIKGLYFPSESEAPIEIADFEKNTDVVTSLKSLHPDKADYIAEADLNDFYEMYGVEKDWQNAIQKQFAKSFGEAINVMKENLENIKIYRIGEVRIDIYIIGKTRDGSFIGLKTSAVET